MQEYLVLLGISSTALHVTAYGAYLLHARAGKCAPSPTGWAISIAITALNALATWLASANALASMQFLAGTAGSTLVCLHLLKRGEFSAFTKQQWIVVFVCAAGFASAKFAADPHVPVVAGFIAMLIAAAPTIRGVWRDPSREHPLAWAIWAAAMSLYATQRSFDDVDAAKYFVPIGAVIISITVVALSQGLHRSLCTIARRAL